MAKTRGVRRTLTFAVRTPIVLSLVPEHFAEWQQKYEAGDTWAAWEVCYWALALAPHGVTVPAWVLTYLERVSKDLIGLMHRSPTPTGPRLGAAVVRVLGLRPRGRGTLVARRRRADRDAEIVRDVAHLVAEGTKPYLAVEAVAPIYGVRRTTVQQVYEAARARAGDTPLDWRRRFTFPNIGRYLRDLPVGALIAWPGYPGGRTRVWIVEAVEADAALIVLVVRPAFPPAR